MAPQNDTLNLSFVKDDMQMAEIWLDMAVKWQLVSLLTFETPSTKTRAFATKSR